MPHQCVRRQAVPSNWGDRTGAEYYMNSGSLRGGYCDEDTSEVITYTFDHFQSLDGTIFSPDLFFHSNSPFPRLQNFKKLEGRSEQPSRATHISETSWCTVDHQRGVERRPLLLCFTRVVFMSALRTAANAGNNIGY